jgi:hypothetical protein
MRVLGYGGCGIIFEQPGRSDVIKKALETVDDDMYDDYVSHVAIEGSFQKLADKCRSFLTYLVCTNS